MNTGYPSSLRGWLTVVLLMAAYILSFIDRQILNLLVEPIKADLQVTDTQMSFLLGLSFAIFYTFCGIPLGRLADSTNRRNVIAGGIFVWSIMTAACGMVRNYWGLLLCRIGVAAGEASLSPSAYSMIADSFPPHRRATAFSVYSMAIYLGSGVALLLGGLVVAFSSNRENLILPVLGAIRPWQTVFLVLGAIGIVFTLIIFLLREPARQGANAHRKMPFSEVLNYVKHQRSAILHHNIGFALLSFSAYGSSAWIPTFFIRTFSMESSNVGIVYGCIVAAFGSTGLVCGGLLSDWLLRRGYRDAPLRIAILSALLTLPLNIGYLVPDRNLAFVLIALHVFTVAMPFGVGPHAIQEIVPSTMRGQSTAIYLFIITLIGLGIGPTAVALCTDYVFGYPAAVRYSLTIITGISLIAAAVVLTMGLKHYRRALDDLQTWTASQEAADTSIAAT